MRLLFSENTPAGGALGRPGLAFRDWHLQREVLPRLAPVRVVGVRDFVKTGANAGECGDPNPDKKTFD
jgi:hypothetical protein